MDTGQVKMGKLHPDSMIKQQWLMSDLVTANNKLVKKY
jgi:hypothetical protein